MTILSQPSTLSNVSVIELVLSVYVIPSIQVYSSQATRTSVTKEDSFTVRLTVCVLSHSLTFSNSWVYTPDSV